MQKTFIVIAAYNEERSISDVVHGLKKEGYHGRNIIVVDDGSNDNTFKEAQKAGATVLKHAINRGQGAALRTGMDYSLKHKAEIIVHFDADGQHNPKEVKDIIQPIINKEADVALGSRFLSKKSDVPLIKRIVLKMGVVFTFIFSGIWLTDTHNGFRAFSRKAAENIEITQDKMEHASEIIDLIKLKNIKYREIPVTIKYTKHSMEKGQSPLNSIRIAARLIWTKFLR
ncbi:MAG: glycosyltransferase family 2 protein [Candidatus Woesearchaeota archaeon]|nr:glycosyltransferase family 2 protein [Candidatus Woesearchaeota archaeon]